MDAFTAVFSTHGQSHRTIGDSGVMTLMGLRRLAARTPSQGIWLFRASCSPRLMFARLDPRALDALIRVHGPRTSVWSLLDQRAQQAQAARPKGTDQVAPSAAQDEDAALHGGDGNSGEVDHAAASAKEIAHVKEEPSGLSQSSTSEDGNTAPAGDLRPEQPAGTTESSSDASSDAATARSCAESVTADDPAPRRDGAGDVADAQTAPSAPHEPKEEGSDSSRHADQQGSDSAESERTNGTPFAGGRHDLVYGGMNARTFVGAGDKPLARRISRALERLLRTRPQHTGDGSPRIDGERLVREIAYRRYALSRARRSEQGREMALIAVDASGSCSSFSQELWDAVVATAFAAGGTVRGSEDAHVPVPEDCPLLAVLTSNGLVGPDNVPLHEYVETLGVRLNTMVVLGDCDGIETYRTLCEHGERFVWLDNYRASHSVTHAAASRRRRYGLELWGRQPFAHICGVGTPASVLEALAIVCRGATRGTARRL